MKFGVERLLSCINCGGQIELSQVQSEKHSEVEAGFLSCLGCSTDFPIINYIPRMVERYNYSNSWGVLWKNTFDTVTDEFTETSFYKDALHGKYAERNSLEPGESVFGFSWPEKLKGKKVLEVGTGTGCHTVYLAKTDCELISIDHSNAVDCVDEKILTRSNVNVIQTDVMKNAIKREYFDRVWCFQVLQHTPKPPKTLQVLATYLKKGGLLSVTSYGSSFDPWYYKFTRRIPDDLSWKIITTFFPFFIRLRFGLQNLFNKFGLEKIIRGIFHLFDPRDIYFRCRKGLMKDWIQGIVWDKTGDEKLLMRHVLINTFDSITPRYTNNCKDNATMKIWLKEAGFQSIKVWGISGVRATATKK